jgi:hypothetical protein
MIRNNTLLQKQSESDISPADCGRHYVDFAQVNRPEPDAHLPGPDRRIGISEFSSKWGWGPHLEKINDCKLIVVISMGDICYSDDISGQFCFCMSFWAHFAAALVLRKLEFGKYCVFSGSLRLNCIQSNFESESYFFSLEMEGD